MDFFKQRTETSELLTLRALNPRMNLSENISSYYRNLEKGFQGECIFDDWLRPLPNNALVLNDLLLEMNNSLFQIDSTLIYKDIVLLADVKNFEGDSYIEGERWYYKNSKKEIKNPLLQLERSKMLFRQLISDLGYQSPLLTNLVFVNPDFYLYQAPLDPTFIFPSQIPKFITSLSEKPSMITGSQTKLAHQLQSLHIEKSPVTRIPNYSYEQLKKGIVCTGCYTFSLELRKSKLFCRKCGCIEDVTTAVLRCANEISLLFPDKKITVSIMHDWCKIIKSRETIRSVLVNNCKLHRKGRSSFYVSI